jgi:TPP-dependent pyruvate/acetoin dehydrogenase alpha subunit
MDVLAVFEAAGSLIAEARSGGGPALLECKTYRYYDHVGVTGMRIKYREQAEVDQWHLKDPIAALEQFLLADGLLDEAGITAIHDAVLTEIADAIAFADASPPPDLATLTEDVYTNPIAIGAQV